jgi:Ca2+-binding RTX toxin-like protein
MFSQLFSAIWNPSGQKSGSRRSRSGRRGRSWTGVPLRVESLEDRRLFANASLNGGVLIVQGDEGVDDRIQVLSADGVQAVVSVSNPVTGVLSYSGNFAVNQISRVTIYGLSGNDQIYQSLFKPSLIYGGAGNDVLYGNEGNDVFYGEAGADRILGFGGIDLLYGGSDNDILEGGSGNDSLYGGSGNDSLRGGTGNDLLVGEIGNDTYLFSGTLQGNDILHEAVDGGTDELNFEAMSSRVDINLGLATNQIVSLWNGASSLQLRMPTSGSVENITGSAWDDRLIGSNANNSLVGNGGNDTLSGVGGHDLLDGGQGNDLLLGGSGSDTYRFGYATGSLGNDVIQEAANIDSDTLDFERFRQGIGIDLGTNWSSSASRTIATNNLALSISNNTAIENVIGTAYADNIMGNSRNNNLQGRGGDDVLHGGSSEDFLEGGAGDDLMRGGSGWDFYVFGGEADLGSDTVDESNVGNGLMFSTFSRAITLNLGLSSQTVASNLALRMNNPSDFTNVIGSPFADTIFGNSRDNVISAGGGDDRVFGMSGHDVLFGDAGNDLMSGGTGDDSLSGGDGNDELLGEDGRDVLMGHAGLDRLFGGAGNDRLDGGNDDLADVLVGGLGADTFVAEWEFSNLTFPRNRWNRDLPADFVSGQQDSVV